MKLLLTLNPSEDLIEQTRLAKNIGFDGIEIVVEDKALESMLDEEFRENFYNFTKENNLITYFHLPNWLDIREEKDRKEISKIVKEISKSFTNSYFVLHIMFDGVYEIKNFEKSIKKIDTSKILFENLFQDLKFLEEVFKLPINFIIDIQHLSISNPLEKSLEFLARNKNKILHFHFSDTDGINHTHYPLGKGNLPLKKIICFLKNNFDDRTISFEIFNTEIPEIDFEISFLLFKKIYGEC